MNKTSDLPILMEYVTGQQWGVYERTLKQMATVFENHCNRVRIDPAALLEITSTRDQKGQGRGEGEDRHKLVIQGETAIMHIDGIIAKHSRLVNGSSQPRGTSFDILNAQLDAVETDPRIRSLFIQIESPGGGMAGVADFGDRIFELSQKMNVVAFADDLAASAAYWIGSQATSFVASQSAFVGSIGIFSVLVDSSSAAEADGFKVHVVSSGVQKGMGVEGSEITAEHLSSIQTLIDQSFEEFIAVILRGRSGSVSEEALRAVADGRVLKTADAIEAGLIDGVMTLSEAFESAKQNPHHNAAASAAAITSSQAGEDPAQKEQHMTTEQQTADQKAADAVKTAAVQADRTRISDLNAAFGGKPALAGLLAAAIQDGSSVAQTKAAAFDIVQDAHTAELKGKDDELAEATQRLKVIGSAGEGALTGAEAPDGTQVAKGKTGDDGEAATYQDAVDTAITAGMSPAKAYRNANVRYPEAAAAWNAEQTKTRDAAIARREN